MNRLFRYSIILTALLVLVWAGTVWQRDGRLPLIGGKGAAPDQSGAVAGPVGQPGAAPGPVAAAAATGSPAAVPAAQAAIKSGGDGGRDVIVNTVIAEAVRLEDQITAVGSLLAAQSVQVAAEIAGRIVEVAISDGSRVARGDILFRLDDDVIAAELAQARAELDLAQANLKRTRNLARDNFVSERSRDEALSNVNVLQARLQVVAARQSRTRIPAPFDGIVGLVGVSTGDYVTPGATLVRIDDLSSLKLDMRMPERLFPRVRAGQTIRVGFDAYPDHEFTAHVETIDSQLDPGGRSLLVRGRIDNAQGLLLPGMFARAQLVVDAREGAVMLPEQCLDASANGQHVFVVREGKAFRTSVTTGSRRDGRVEILSGVSAGDQVISAGQIKLRGTGVPVKVVPAGDSRPQDAA